MYFSEKGNVDDDATLITIFLVSFNLQSCCLMQSAVCSLQMPYTVVVDTICDAPIEGIIIFGYWALSGSKQGRDQGGGAQNIIEWYFVQL